MRVIPVLVLCLAGLLLEGCGGGGGNGSANSSTNLFPVGRQTVGGVSLIPTLATYNGSGQYNSYIQNVGCTETDFYPMWGMFGCAYSAVTIASRPSGGWTENHQLPAHVAAYSSTVDYDSRGNLVKDSMGCTFKSVDGLPLSLPKHPDLGYGNQVSGLSLIRVCGNVNTPYEVMIRVRGDDTFPITDYNMYSGGKRVMYIVLMNNLIGGKLNTSEINVSTLDGSDNVASTQNYVSLLYMGPR